MTMCRTRLEIIQNEPEVQKLISIKEKMEAGEINGFEEGRLIFELTKLESQIESTIREIQATEDREVIRKQAVTDRDLIRKDILAIEQATKEGFEKHYAFHRKNPSLIALFRKSPTGMLSLGGAGLVASSLFYVKETRDVIFSLVGLESVAGQDLLNYGFPLFLFLLITGTVTFINSGSKDKKEEGEQ